MHGLLGHTTLARDWLDEAERRNAASTSKSPLAGTRTIVRLREGQFAAAARDLEDEWPRLTQSLPGEQLRPLTALRAFAVASSSDIRDVAAVDRVLAPLQPVTYAELAYLGAAWPELDQFLRTHLPS